MAKDTISATVDPEVSEWLDQEGRNRSETINKAVKAYMSSDGSEKAMLTLRKEQLKSQERTLETELESVREEIASVDDRLSDIDAEAEQDRAAIWREALDKLRFTHHIALELPSIDSADGMVEYYAEELGMDTDAFREEIRDRAADREGSA